MRLGRVARTIVREPEFVPLLVALGAIAAVFGFIQVASAVTEGNTRQFDVWLLRAARRHVVPSLESTAGKVAFDVTALGSTSVLTLVVVWVAGFLSLQRMPGLALYVALCAMGGGFLQGLLKNWFVRPRPHEITPLLPTASFSFPSGHAMASAAVYLAVGALLAASIERRAAKLYVLAVAFLLTFAIGVTRVLLGVHYPTDVLAGWMAGFAWALACWIPFEVFRMRRGSAPH